MSLRYVGRTGLQRRAGPFFSLVFLYFILSISFLLSFSKSKKSLLIDLGPSCRAATAPFFLFLTLRIIFKNVGVSSLVWCFVFLLLFFHNLFFRPTFFVVGSILTSVGMIFTRFEATSRHAFSLRFKTEQVQKSVAEISFPTSRVENPIVEFLTLEVLLACLKKQNENPNRYVCP